jgi:hypothetical protein
MVMKKFFLLSSFLFALSFTGISQEKTENLKIIWPEAYQWKIASSQENGNIHLMEVIPGKETVETWTMIGTMMSIKGAKGISVEQMMNTIFSQAQQEAEKAKLTALEKNLDAGHPWILFKIEAPAYNSDKKPESQLYYVVQGETSVFVSSIALKKTKLKKAFVKKWSAVFKASELVYQ